MVPRTSQGRFRLHRIGCWEFLTFIPTVGKFDDVRSFGEQGKHVACNQFAFFNEFEGRKPPDDCEKGGHDPAETKAELIKISQGLLLQPCPAPGCGQLVRTA